MTTATFRPPRSNEDRALLAIMRQGGEITAAHVESIKAALGQAGGGPTPDPIRLLLDQGVLSIDRWLAVLARYEAEYTCCPKCLTFLRAPSRDGVKPLHCSKCQTPFTAPPGASVGRAAVAVSAPVVPASEPPATEPAPSDRDPGLARALAHGMIDANEARWASEQARRPGMPPGFDALAALVAGGLIAIEQRVYLEKEDVGEAHPVALGHVDAEPARISVRRKRSSRRVRGTGTSDRLDAAGAVELAATLARVADSQRRLAEREAAEREAREAAEKAAREAAQREAAERAVRDAAAREAASREAEAAAANAADAAAREAAERAASQAVVAPTPSAPVAPTPLPIAPSAANPFVPVGRGARAAPVPVPLDLVGGDYAVDEEPARTSITDLVRKAHGSDDDDKPAAPKPAKPREPRRVIALPAAPVGATTIGASELAERVAAAGKEALDLSGLIVDCPVELGGVKLKGLVCEGTYFTKKVNLRKVTLGSKLALRGAVFAHDFDCRDATLSDGADLVDTHFAKQAQFNATAFGRYANLRKATFHGPARFTRTKFPAGAGFELCSFLSEASFNELLVKHRAKFEGCTFDGDVTFSNARFEEVFDLTGSEFGAEAKFKGCAFVKMAVFNDVIFRAEANFTAAMFEAEASFRGVMFEGMIVFRALSAERSLMFQSNLYGPAARFVFTDMHVSRFVCSRDDLAGRLDNHVQGRWAQANREYGLLKNNFRQLNNYDDEDWAYLMEKRSARRAMAIGFARPFATIKRFLNWLALDLSCGYGTRPANILATSLAVVLGFAALFIGLDRAAPGRHFALEPGAMLTYEDALMFSYKTFINADLVTVDPVRASWINALVAGEAFVGIFAVTVLVITFSRKVIR